MHLNFQLLAEQFRQWASTFDIQPGEWVQLMARASKELSGSADSLPKLR